MALLTTGEWEPTNMDSRGHLYDAVCSLSKFFHPKPIHLHKSPFWYLAAIRLINDIILYVYEVINTIRLNSFAYFSVS